MKSPQTLTNKGTSMDLIQISLQDLISAKTLIRQSFEIINTFYYCINRTENPRVGSSILSLGTTTKQELKRLSAIFTESFFYCLNTKKICPSI